MNGAHMGPHRKSLSQSAWVALAFLILSCTATAQDERAQVLQAVIDHPALAQYFHEDTVPGRKPLVLVLDKVDPSWQLRKFGQPVVVSERKAGTQVPAAFLDVTAIDVTDKTADVRFEYRVEGLQGRFQLQKNGSWQIVKADLKEK